MTTPRYAHTDLHAYAQALLEAAGLETDKATAVAEILATGDIMGHTTHGLALLPGYLGELESGGMQKLGVPTVIADAPAAVTWDGRRLPGPWLVLEAMALAEARASTLGTCTVVIRRSHHIGCLAAYHPRATERGLLMLLTCSDPNTQSVAPFGGLDAVFTPNPISAGFPVGDGAVVMDISTSATTNGLTNRLHKEGSRLPADWVIDGQGVAGNDPAVLFQEPRGTILPLGGLDSGHKGYGLALLVEALTGGLAGHGRADPGEGWGATVFLQIIDPRVFAELDAFERQMGHVAQACRASRPAQSGLPVRLPGEKGHTLADQGRREGVALHGGILPALTPWAMRLGVPEPVAL